jgi:hypothetical protein
MNSYRIFLVVFITAMVLRLGLAFVNRSANDNHIDVINLIADKKFIPERADCWSCYQPKLYYLLSAGVAKLFHCEITARRIIAAQLLNVVFAFFTLLFFWKFLKCQPIRDELKLLLFAFFSLNPCLAAINIQHTNDTLGILCGVASIYFADNFFKTWKRRDFILMAAFVVAGALTKGGGLIIFGVLFFYFMLKIIFLPNNINRMTIGKYAVAFTLIFISVVPLAGGYYTSYVKYQSLSLSTWERDPPPHFFESTPVARPGITDMFTGWFTFRYIEMVKYPYISNDPERYPIHRTSLWSQLYGRTMFLHFDQWPPAWQTMDRFIIEVGRILILLGIIPLFLFLFGTTRQIYLFLRGIFTNGAKFLKSETHFLHTATAAAFLLSAVFYSYNYRDFSSMKSIYIFPGMLSYIKLMSQGCASIRNKKAFNIIAIFMMLIIVLFTVDISYLLYQQVMDRYFIK